jgi:hypothetical protein
MAVTGILSNHFKKQLGSGSISLTSDSIKILLIRDGYTFDPDNCKIRDNIKGSITGSSDIDFTASDSSINKSGGGFLNAGFIVGNQISISGTTNNNITTIITDVTDTKITVSGTITDETGTSAVISIDDEITTANGYTQDSKVIGTVTATEYDDYDYVDYTFPTVTWTASGGDITASGALLYDDTSTDKTVIGYLDFGGAQTATDGTTFNIVSGTFRIQ